MEKTTFIKVDKFDTVLGAIAIIKKKLNDAKNTLDKVNALKQEEDLTVQKWASDLDAVQMKVNNLELELTNDHE